MGHKQERKQSKYSYLKTMWFYIPKFLKKIVQKTSNLINTFSKVAEYKIRKQKSISFLYTNIEIDLLRDKSQKHYLPQWPLGIVIATRVKDLNNKNFKTQQKEIGKDIRI